MFRISAFPVLLLGAVLAAAPPAHAAGEDPDPKEKVRDVPDKEADEARERFVREFDTEDLDLQIEAIRRLRKVVHPDVASVLLDLAFKHDNSILRAEAFRGLRFQKTSSKSVGVKVARWLGEAAEENRKMKARGNYGVKVDPKTGEVDTESEEGRAALRNKRDRGQMLAEAVGLVRDLEYRDRKSVEVFTEFLSDGNDDLVALVLESFGQWKEWTVLPDLLEIFEMYPEEDRFETGSVSVDTGASGSTDQQAAKRKWMAKFGDPDRRRARPKVVRALKAALLEITGEKFTEPRELREFLRRSDVKRKVRGR